MVEIDKNLPPLVFRYRNWQGEIAVRHAIPISVWYGHTEWHPDDGWLMTAWDTDKDAERTFSMSDILEINPKED